MKLDEVIQLIKQALEKVNPDKHTEFRFTVGQVKQLLGWLEEYKQLKTDYIDIDKQLRTANTENDELKRMLRLAVEDFDKLANVESCYYPFCGERCPFDCTGGCEEREWKHRDEAMKLLGGVESVD